MLEPVEHRLDALEAKVQELEAMLTLAFRLLSIERPVSALLERFGATEAEDLVTLLLDALKLDRPAYRKLHAFVVQERWLEWR